MARFSVVTHNLMRLCQGLVLAVTASTAWSVETTAEQTPVQWEQWSAGVLDRAQQEGRLVLLDLTAEWCQFCRKMDEVTFRDQDVVDVINARYIPVRVDDKDQHAFAKRYAKVVRPATIILDDNGNELIRKPGYLEPQWMVWMLQAVALNPSSDAHR